MSPKEILLYYSRKDVQEALIQISRNREVVGVFKNGAYSNRPNVIEYPDDIITMVRQGAVEFHTSVERWSRPMALKSDNYKNLRAGWDMIFDLDCEDFRHGKIAAEVVIWGLKKHGIRNISLKYTGGDGFHIGIPWESIPKKINYNDSSNMFPDLGRVVGLYLREYIRDRFEARLIQKWDPKEIGEHMKRPPESLITEEKFDPFKVVDIDPVLISPRHLFRAPYSLNKKSFLVSIPLSENELKNFEKEKAKTDYIKTDMRFLDRAEPDEAATLIAEALDWNVKWAREERKKKRREREGISAPVPETLFPPCIHNILKGLPDGRKRSVFILINFLKSMKWPWEDIEIKVVEWNEKNPKPLPENYIRSHLRWHRDKAEFPPPGCKKVGYYEDFGVCQPDMLCGGDEKTVGNPVVYHFRKEGRNELKSKKKGRMKKRAKISKNQC